MINLTIGSITYTQADIRSIALKHEVNPITATLPINQIEIVMQISQSTPVATWLTLTIDGQIWCKYWVLSCTRASANTYKVKAQSAILLLSRITMPAKMYSSMTVADAVAELMPSGLSYTVDATIGARTISGYCKEQNARDRLQQICFAAGAVVRSFFSSNPIEVIGLDTDADYVPPEKIYRRPKIEYEDVVTAIEVTAYTYTQGTPSAVDEYVQIGNDYYIVSTQVITIANPDAVASDPTNIVKVKECTLINADNASTVATRIATYYFNRIKWTGKILNSGEYLTGDKLSVNTYSATEIISGYATSMKFGFGVGQNADVTLEQAESVEAGSLTVIYTYDGAEITRKVYTLPVGYVYNISNPALWYTSLISKGIYIPLTASVTGTVASGQNTASAAYEEAIIQPFSNRYAEVYAIDDAEQKGDGKVVFK